MSYFNNAFPKAFPSSIGTGVFAGVNVDGGFVTDSGVTTSQLRAIADAGAPVSPAFGLFTKDTFTSVDAASAEIINGAPLILAGSSIMPNDKIGPFHGGYAESNKSKYINPRYVNNVYKFAAAPAEQSIWHVGNTNAQPATTLLFVAPCGSGYTPGVYVNVPTTTSGVGTGLTVNVEVNAAGEIVSMVENLVGTGYAVSDTITPDATVLGHDGVGAICNTTEILSVGVQSCEFEFLCNETYNLYINLYGSPVLRVLNHDAYRNLAAYTGCCPKDSIVPVAVDSTLVFIDWAKQIIESPYLKDFIRPIVFDETGLPWFATADEAVAEGWPATQVWTNYVSTGHIDGAVGGIRIIGAYIDTQFGTCSYQVSDFFQKEIVQMDISLADENGDPCTFSGLCTFNECCGFGGQGFGDTYLKEILMCESYLQNHMSTDPRIREITQGNALRDVVDRFALYDKYVIQHTVPRINNPTSVFDNDQYNLCIYVPAGTDLSTFELLVGTWLTNSGNHLGAEVTANGGFTEYGEHTTCTVEPLPLP